MFDSTASLAETLHRIAEGSHTFQERADLEYWLLRHLRDQGTEALAGLLVDVEGLGFSFTRSDEPPDGARFASPLASGHGTLVVATHLGADSASVDVSVEPVAVDTPEDPRHRRFYALWEEVSGLHERELAELDEARRAVYLVALLEAEVMNGGLGQYAANTGCVHLDETLRILEEIGTEGTLRAVRGLAGLAASFADMAALWEEKGRELEDLDETFLSAGEDLAAGVMDRFFGPGSAGA